MSSGKSHICMSSQMLENAFKLDGSPVETIVDCYLFVYDVKSQTIIQNNDGNFVL